MHYPALPIVRRLSAETFFPKVNSTAKNRSCCIRALTCPARQIPLLPVEQHDGSTFLPCSRAVFRGGRSRAERIPVQSQSADDRSSLGRFGSLTVQSHSADFTNSSFAIQRTRSLSSVERSRMGACLSSWHNTRFSNGGDLTMLVACFQMYPSKVTATYVKSSQVAGACTT